MMRDFMMWEMEPMSLHASFSLAANYSSSLKEDGEGEVEKAPSNPPGALTYQEMYEERKLSPPWHPASVIHAQFTETPGATMPLVPPLPGEEVHASTSELSPTGGPSESQVKVHLFAPALCSAKAQAPELPSAIPSKDKPADPGCLERQCALLHALQLSSDWNSPEKLSIETSMDCSSVASPASNVRRLGNRALRPF